MANKIPSTSVKKKHKDVINERNMLSTTAFAISRKLDDVVKRSRSTRQRILILLKSIMNTQSKHRCTDNLCNITSSNSRHIAHNQKKLFNLQDLLFRQSVQQAIDICIQVREERENHIKAIEVARNKTIYDDDNKYIDTVISRQGKQEYDLFLTSIKEDVFENITGNSNTTGQVQDTSKLTLLQTQYEKWQTIMEELQTEQCKPNTTGGIKCCYKIVMEAKRQTACIFRTLQDVKQQEWINSKNHLLRIGKFGAIACMVHPKSRSGPVAGKLYPTKPNKPARLAINDRERMEASLLTHQMWMDNPPGQVNCHFLEKVEDDMGINGININPDKAFDEEAEWSYLKGILLETTPHDIADRIRQAHKKL
jgi:L-rhamnose mutarotase